MKSISLPMRQCFFFVFWRRISPIDRIALRRMKVGHRYSRVCKYKMCINKNNSVRTSKLSSIKIPNTQRYTKIY